MSGARYRGLMKGTLGWLSAGLGAIASGFWSDSLALLTSGRVLTSGRGCRRASLSSSLAAESRQRGSLPMAKAVPPSFRAPASLMTVTLRCRPA